MKTRIVLLGAVALLALFGFAVLGVLAMAQWQ
jgi:hypothetical protein